MNAYYRERWERRPDVRASKAAYRQGRPDIYVQASAAWRERNPEKVRAGSERYYAANAETQRAKSAAYHAENRAACLRKMSAMREGLADSYVATALRLRLEHTPPSLLEAKRAQLALTRLIKEIAK